MGYFDHNLGRGALLKQFSGLCRVAMHLPCSVAKLPYVEITQPKLLLGSLMLDILVPSYTYMGQNFVIKIVFAL
jgi:hypothetical protein